LPIALERIFMRLISRISLFVVAGCIGTSPLHATAGDAAKGKARSAELYCAACHGVNGNSETAEWPSLAGQNVAYLVRQLELLRAGARTSAEMQPIAATLTDPDIADLAAYYAEQTAKTNPRNGDDSKVGEVLYRSGDPTRGIPACSSCHGQSGEGNAATGDPAVRAQQPVYSIRQLEAYAKRTRYASAIQVDKKNENLEIMYQVSGKLTADEMSAVAAYLHVIP
jgi:cytochrome c553